MQIVMKKLSDIHPYDTNPRDNKEAIKEVVKSIKRFGPQQPIVLDPKDNTIVVGHTRYEAAKVLGMSEFPCKYADKLTVAEIKAYRLMDNKTHEFAKWRKNLLDSEISNVATEDETLTAEFMGFEVSSADNIGDAPPPPDETKQFIVAVHCRNEQEMQEIFEEMQEREIPCNLIT